VKVKELAAKPPKVLIYGPAGRGKSALALTLGERSQIIDMDGNLDVAFGLHDNLQDERLNVDVKQFLELDPTKGVAFAKVKKYILNVVNDCAKGKYEFEVLTLDSLTSLSVAAQNYVMYNSGRIGENPEIQHWGMILTEIENVITALRALPIRVFFIAHENIFTSKEVKRIQIAMPGQKLPGRITRMFSEIYYIRIRDVGQGKGELYIQTAPTSMIICRSNRGLRTRYVFGNIGKNGTPDGDSVSLWTILKEIENTDQRKESTK